MKSFLQCLDRLNTQTDTIPTTAAMKDMIMNDVIFKDYVKAGSAMYASTMSMLEVEETKHCYKFFLKTMNT